jgi:hypothetical protein
MRDVVLSCIEKYSDIQLNISSAAAREKLANDIVEALVSRGAYKEYPEQIHSLNDVEDPVFPQEEAKYIYESPDHGNTVYRREFGDLTGTTKVRLGFFEHKNQLNLNLMVQPMNLQEAKDFEMEYMKEHRDATNKK